MSLQELGQRIGKARAVVLMREVLDRHARTESGEGGDARRDGLHKKLEPRLPRKAETTGDKRAAKATC